MSINPTRSTTGLLSNSCMVYRFTHVVVSSPANTTSAILSYESLTLVKPSNITRWLLLLMAYSPVR